MSRQLFGKRARDLEPGRGGAPGRPHPRALRALAVVEPRRRAGAQQRRAARACARRASSPRRQERAAHAARRPHHRLAPAWPTRAPATRRSTCASSSASGSATTIRRTGRCTRRFLPAVQQAAERAVEEGLRGSASAACRRPWWPSTRRRATSWPWWAGATSTPRPFNRAVRSRRQPGSAFKPFVYAAALERGLSPVSVLDRPALGDRARTAGVDAAQRGARTRPTRPTLREALLESNNQAAVALQLKIGTGPVLDLAADLGLRDQPGRARRSPWAPAWSRPLELTAAYAVFPNGGYAVTPRAIVRVAGRERRPSWSRTPCAASACSPEEVAFQMLTMLRDVVDLGTASSARSLGVRGPAGGKTGTTNEFKDAWFVGLLDLGGGGRSGSGFDQPEPIGAEAYGARVALPIWADFMRRAARVLPAGGVRGPLRACAEVELCRISYLRPVDGLPDLRRVLQGGRRRPAPPLPAPPGQLQAGGAAGPRRRALARRPQAPGHLQVRRTQCRSNVTARPCGSRSGSGEVRLLRRALERASFIDTPVERAGGDRDLLRAGAGRPRRHAPEPAESP